ncbi:DUF3239 domain-containing protein [Corynebacterium sp. 335C]
MDGFRFTVDEAHAKATNEYFRDSRRLRTSAAIMAVLSIAAAVAVVALWGSGVWTWIAAAILALFALSCLYVLVALPKQIGTPQELYDRWPLAPALVAEVNPRDMTLLALVDVAAEGDRPRPALAVRTVTSIPGVPRRTGARVPSVAVSGRHAAGGEVWDEVTPVPLAWGTRDKKVIAAAEAEIPRDDWLRLQSLAERAPEVRGTRRGLLEL